jgi:hypothetical protein
MTNAERKRFDALVKKSEGKRFMTKAEAAVIAAAVKWHYFTTVVLRGVEKDTTDMLHRAVASLLRERGKR